jgi:phosphatidylglycerol:prolipoprotein diacylglycerol transferase
MGAVASLAGGFSPVLGYWIINIDPILLRLGSIAVHWYGLMYVVGISMGLWAIRRYTHRLGIHEDQMWGLFIWTAIAGLIGGRLYYVVQQPDLVQHFLLRPVNIIAVWDGGMAFFGAIFLGGATLFYLAPRYGLSPWIALDGGALFAIVGQIFGRVGNIVNGDIVGYALSSGPINLPADTCAHAPCIAYVPDAHIPWYATVYLNPGAFHPTGIPYVPAAAYEIGLNLIMLAILWQFRYLLPRLRAGYFFAFYLGLYSVSQIVVFFVRDNVLTPFLGIGFLKQAQWTGIFVLVFAVPALVLLARRFSAPWRYDYLHPVPWAPAEAGGLARADGPALAVANGPAARAGAAVGPRARRSGLAARSKPAPAANATSATTATNAAAASAGVAVAVAEPPRAPDAAHPAEAAPPAPAEELPPWEPYHPVGGELRNVFGAPRRRT